MIRGETLNTFEAALAELRIDKDGNEIPLTMDLVTTALAEVSKTIFPFRALESQKQWMRKNMRKPQELSTRQTAAALSRINN